MPEGFPTSPTLQTTGGSQYLFSFQTRAAVDLHRVCSCSGASGACCARCHQARPGHFYHPCIYLKFCFLSLKGGSVPPEELAEEAQGSYPSAISSSMFREGEKEGRTTLSGKFKCAGQDMVKLVPQGHLDLRS